MRASDVAPCGWEPAGLYRLTELEGSGTPDGARGRSGEAAAGRGLRFPGRAIAWVSTRVPLATRFPGRGPVLRIPVSQQPAPFSPADVTRHHRPPRCQG